jgi:SAM-dependent methyltransferase
LVSELNDPAAVRAEYEDEAGLVGRRAAYRFAEGPSAPDLVFEAVAEVAPSSVLEVGCGPGELSERIARELGSTVVAVDASERMVDLARSRGVDARVGDVQELPFADGAFDCAVAAWMLYHVPDVDGALRELARVVRPGGRLVVATNYLDHLRELRELVGAWPRSSPFSGEDAPTLLGRHFRNVDERDAAGVIRFPTRQDVLDYLRAAEGLFGHPTAVPEFEVPFEVRMHAAVFVSER